MEIILPHHGLNRCHGNSASTRHGVQHRCQTAGPDIPRKTISDVFDLALTEQDLLLEVHSAVKNQVLVKGTLPNVIKLSTKLLNMI